MLFVVCPTGILWQFRCGLLLVILFAFSGWLELFTTVSPQDGWVIPNPSGETAHFEKGKKVLLGILVGAH
jgi:hypothetical protein